MKIHIKNLLLLPALVAGLGLIPAGRVMAQAFTNLHSFAGHPSDGDSPFAGLIISGNTLYGTAAAGGRSSYGTVFAININGTGFTNLHSFTYSSDGGNPNAGLILSSNTLYGTTVLGGSSGYGTVFAVNTNGTGFTNLYSFTGGSDGASPFAGLIISGNTLYGTEIGDGISAGGAVFSIHTDGTGITNLYHFTFGSDGYSPYASLILSGITLYGTALYGGSAGQGTLFAINTNGTGFTNLHSFSAALGSSLTNSDGSSPYAGLILSGKTLYGTAYVGGSAGQGTVFAVNIDSTGFTNLHSFIGGSDGGSPYAGLIISDKTLYGTTQYGGSSGQGTVFAVNTNGTGFTNLYSFTALLHSTNSDGANPSAGLILSGNILYGTAFRGGSSGKGTVFSLSLGSVSAPQLTIIRSITNVVLTWPTNAPGFTLQSTTNLVPPAVWTTVSPGQVVVNGQNTVTNPASSGQKFYRLSQ
jgi:uncharacterized repeat protein (TIGR03803 family)